MFAISPQFLARITHLPRASAFDPKTPFFFGNGYSTFWIQASQNSISLHKIINFICINGFRTFFTYYRSFTFYCACPIMLKIQARNTIKAITNITLYVILFSGHTFIKRYYIFASFKIGASLFSVNNFFAQLCQCFCMLLFGNLSTFSN